MKPDFNSSQVDKIKETILPILLSYGVTKAGFFGSAAHGKMTKRSDIESTSWWKSRKI